jgi:hypothetical protein
MTDIQAARDALARWGEGTTKDRWVTRLTNAVEESMQPGGRVVAFDGYTGADAALIVAMTDPRLRAALDGMLAFAQEEYLSWYGPNGRAEDDGEPEPYFLHLERIAAAILDIDKGLNA